MHFLYYKDIGKFDLCFLITIKKMVEVSLNIFNNLALIQKQILLY